MVSKLPLQNGKFALVDDEDYERCSKYTWTVQAHGGSGRTKSQNRVFTTIHSRKGSKSLKLTKFILGEGFKDGRLLIFKNGNDLDFRKTNLVFAESQSRKNQLKRGVPNTSSKYKGVSWASKNNKWCARIGLDGVYKNLGYFEDEDDAARAYNAKALEFYGASAFQNVIGENNSASKAKIPRPLKPRKPKEFTSDYRGVSLDRSFKARKFRARFRGKEIGFFDDEVEAAKAYDQEAFKKLGDKAVLNFPRLIVGYRRG